MSRSLDKTFMQMALSEGKKARLHSSPNPWVGCVIVKNDQVVGKGWTSPPGRPHAEVMALEEAGGNAEEATVYVTLEPCSHWGRTAPCVEALIKARVARVVIAAVDPDPQVNGLGISKLKEAGIRVDSGVCRELAEIELRSYFYHRKNQIPFCVLKTAMSFDGRAAASDGSSQWITCRKAREDAHRLRAESQAIMIGSRTAIKDLPRLTVREADPPSTPPYRVLLDSTGSVKANGPLFDLSLGPLIIYTTSRADPNTLLHWKKRGAIVVQVLPSPTDIGAYLPEVMKDLAKRGVMQVLIEGGATLHGECLRQGFADELHLYVGNCLLGSDGKAAFGGVFTESIKTAPRFQLELVLQLESTAKLVYQKNR